MSRFSTLAATLLACGVLAVPASAAPDRTVTLSASQTAASWDGTGATGVTPLGIYQCRAGGLYNCDDTLLDLKAGGSLKASAEVDSADYRVTLHLYRAGADGAPDGNALGEGEIGQSTTLTVNDLEAGQYVLRIAFRIAADANFSAKATLVPAVAPAAEAPAAPAPATSEQPAAAPKPAAKKKKPSCKAKARKIKNAKKRKAALKRCAKRKK